MTDVLHASQGRHMNKDRQKQKDAKREYVTPKLRPLGNLTDLTRGGSFDIPDTGYGNQPITSGT